MQEELYPELVEEFIRQRYTISQELAIHRQRDTKPTEFANYNSYCEECKAKAKEDTKNKLVRYHNANTNNTLVHFANIK